jgi:hypothetical protein
VTFIRDSDGDFLLTPSFNEDRTVPTLTPSEPLLDGKKYDIDLSAFQDAAEKGLVAADFEQGLAGTDDDGSVEFLDDIDGNPLSITAGVNNGQPAAPALPFEGGTQTDADYPEETVGTDIVIDADDQGGLVAGYELFVKTAATEEGLNTDEDGFPLEPAATFGVDEIAFGEISASVAIGNNGEDDDGDGQVDEQDELFPLIAPGGNYAPVEIHVEAVSINDVASAPSAILEIEGMVAPSVDDAESDVSGGTITVTYDEPLNLDFVVWGLVVCIAGCST